MFNSFTRISKCLKSSRRYSVSLHKLLRKTFTGLDIGCFSTRAKTTDSYKYITSFEFLPSTNILVILKSTQNTYFNLLSTFYMCNALITYQPETSFILIPFVEFAHGNQLWKM